MDRRFQVTWLDTRDGKWHSRSYTRAASVEKKARQADCIWDEKGPISLIFNNSMFPSPLKSLRTRTLPP